MKEKTSLGSKILSLIFAVLSVFWLFPILLTLINSFKSNNYVNLDPFALPNSEIMIHQPLISGGLKGQATDVKIYTDHLLRTKEKMNKILSENTGKTYEQVCEDTERDNFMSADEAAAYGLVDKVIAKKD